ncbi:MAG: replicative DNA helicase [Acidimicrobiia bacterium]
MGDERYIPADVDAERAVLAAVLTAPDALDEVLDVLTPEVFSVRAHQNIYLAVLECEAQDLPVNQIMVADQLRKARLLKKSGGPEFLESLVENAVYVEDVAAHAQLVADKAKLRELIVVGQQVARAALAVDAEADTVLEQAETAVFAVGETRSGSSMVSIAEAAPAALLELTAMRNSKLVGVSTGFEDLDRITAGFQSGQLVLIAGRPGMGKSAIALQIAKAMAIHSGKTIPFLSYEMSTNELMSRLISAEVQYDLASLRSGVLPAGIDRDLQLAVERLSGLSLMIDDNPPASISGVRAAIRRLARRRELGGLVVDYIQLMEGERRWSGANRNEEVSTISRGFKRLASELDIPVVALSQLSRGLEQRNDKRPQLSDLRDSGALEQDASTVLFAYRPVVYDPSADERAAELIVAKQRSGPTGTVHLDWDGGTTSFCDVSPQIAQARSVARTHSARSLAPVF